MGLLDSALDQAAGMLGGDTSGAAPKPDKCSPLKWLPGDDITPPADKPPITSAPNAGDSKHTGVNEPGPIEFPHYGYVHNEMSNFWSMPTYDNEVGQKPAGRAILFRDAVEREALLLYGFIVGTKSAQEDYKKSFGALGAVSGMINKLAGTTGASDPDPASLIFLLDDIATNTKPINDKAIKYQPIHLAGINLHQTRSDYQKYCTEKLDKAFLKKKDDSPADSVAKLVNLSFLGDGANFIFSLLSKATNIYLGVFLVLRNKYEPEIEKVCHDTSIDVIQKYKINTFSWWFTPPKPAQNNNNSNGTQSGIIGDAEKAVKSATDTVDSTKKDVLKEIGTDDSGETPPGDASIDLLFAAFGSAPSVKDPENQIADLGINKTTPKPADDGGDKSKPKQLKPDEVCSAFVKQGFSAVIFGDPKDSTIDTAVAGAIAKYVEAATWASVEYMKTVYKELCKNPEAISDKFMLDAAHDTIFDRIFDKLEHLSDTITKVKKTSIGIQGDSVGPEKLIDKGQDLLKQKLGPKLDMILKQIACDLKDRFEKIRVYAYDADYWNIGDDPGKWHTSPSKNLAMEPYFGQLPFFLTLCIRNMTFPVWKMLIMELLGGQNTALETALKPISGFLADAGDIADRLKKANDLYNAEGANVGTGPQNATKYAAIAMAAKQQKAGGKKPKTDGYPGALRITKCDKIEDIVQDDIDKAKKDRVDTWSTNVPS